MGSTAQNVNVDVHGYRRSKAVHAIRQQILAGALPLGQRLPSEERLAVEFGVSRSTLRNALDDLQSEGLVQRRRHLGCVVVGHRLEANPLMTQTIVLISNVAGSTRPHLFNGHLASINSGVMDYVQGQGLNFMLVPSSLEVPELVTRLAIDRPLGVVVSSLVDDAGMVRTAIGRLREAGLPVVIHSDEAAFKDSDRVISDHKQGTYELVRDLFAAGRRRILRLWTGERGDGENARWWVAAHNRGYERAVKDLGLDSINPLWVSDLLARDELSRTNFDTRVRQIMGFLYEQHRLHSVDAVLLVSDCDVPIVAAAYRMMGIHVVTSASDTSNGVAVCGYDNYWDKAPESQWEPTPPFASIDKQNHLIGEELVRLILDRANGRLDSSPCVRTVPQRLVRFQQQ